MFAINFLTGNEVFFLFLFLYSIQYACSYLYIGILLNLSAQDILMNIFLLSLEIKFMTRSLNIVFFFILGINLGACANVKFFLKSLTQYFVASVYSAPCCSGHYATHISERHSEVSKVLLILA